MPSYYKVKHIGKLASDLLVPGVQGSILASVSRAIYLYLEALDEIIWLMDERVPLHRRGLQVVGAIPHLSVGSPFIIEGRTLIAEAVRADFSNATLWEMQGFICNDKTLPNDLFIRVRELAISLIKTSNPSSFGEIIPGLLDATSEYPPSFEEKPFVTLPPLAQTIIEEWLKAVVEGDHLIEWEKAQSLLGLGPGLTPSGDDFIGGVLFGSHVLNQICPTAVPLRLATKEDFLTYARSFTNPISFTLLKDHALGHSMEPLHQLAHGLLQGQPLEPLLEITRQLIQIGHSTGWDILAGFITILLLVLSQTQT